MDLWSIRNRVLRANEAGKSTLLEFIRRILFGFPARRVGTNEYPPLVGGRHGGRIAIATDAGESIVIDRAPGRGDGPVSMTTDAGETIPDGELSRLLGNHRRGVFNNIFAFTLDELHDESLLGNESVNRQIYSAGIGAVRLPTALDTLQSQKQEIFRPRGSNQTVPKVIAQIQETETALRSIAEHGVEYRRQSERLAEIERELRGLGERRLQLMSEKERHEDLERAWAPGTASSTRRARWRNYRQLRHFQRMASPYWRPWKHGPKLPTRSLPQRKSG